MSHTTSEVIIVGGGPSGVAAALELRRAGLGAVTLLERDQYLGGATRHCSHSPFGMMEFGRVYFGEAYGRRLEREVAEHGIDIRYGHSVVQLGQDGKLLVSNHDGLTTLSAKRVLVTTGVREATRAERLISGDRPIGVLTTGSLQSYVAFHGMMPFKRPIIVGSELVSQSAVLTCLTHGARPVAMIEEREHALVGAPWSWFPTLMGIPFHKNAELVEILGSGRVEAVKLRRGNLIETVACDGVLLSGQFTPEASLFQTSRLAVDWGSAGPCVDQDGRCDNPIFFAAGNVLRAVESGGWAFREGRSVGRSIAADLAMPTRDKTPLRVTYDDPIKLVVPNLIRSGAVLPGGLRGFQLRFLRRARGALALCVEGREIWKRHGLWRPESRITVARPEQIRLAEAVHFSFREEV